MEHLEWKKLAACLTPTIAGADWYADKGTLPFEKAMTVCRKCLVRRLCLEEAMRNEEAFGIWGGMSAQERHRRMRIESEHRLVVR